MGQKINPIAYRLAIKHNWLSISFSHSHFIDFFIRDFINGVLLAWNYFSSPIVIKKYPGGQYKIIFIVYNNNFSKNNKNIIYIKEFIKVFLEKKLNKNITLVIRETTTFNTNAKILGDWLAKNISCHPTKIKAYLKRALRV